MRIINPTGFLLHTQQAHDHPDGPGVVFIVKATFTLVPDGPAIPSPKQRKFEGDRRYMDKIGRSLAWPTDLVAFKPHTDFIVLGTFYQPAGIARSEGRAAFAFGPLHKELRIRGPRSATRRQDGTWIVTPPGQIASLPLRWEYSAGGLSDRRNPFGLGQTPIPGPSGAKILMMPQIEDPAHPAETPADRYPPANFAPVPPNFEQRRRKLGTRDHHWAVFRAPLPPDDYDPSFHNAAPDGQLAGNRPRGDEAIHLTNMHPKIPELTASLPGLRIRLGILRSGVLGRQAEEVPVQLDTVVVLPDEGQIVLLWRAHVAVAEEDQDSLIEAELEAIPLGTPAPVPDLLDRLRGRKTGQKMTPEAAAATAEKMIAAAVEKSKQGAAAVLGGIRTVVKDSPLPDSLKAMVATENNPATIYSHMEKYIADVLADLKVKYPGKFDHL